MLISKQEQTHVWLAISSLLVLLRRLSDTHARAALLPVFMTLLAFAHTLSLASFGQGESRSSVVQENDKSPSRISPEPSKPAEGFVRTSDPPPKIPRPPAPPDDTRFPVELKSPINLPPAEQVAQPAVPLGPVAVDKLPKLKASTGILPPIKLEARYSEPYSLAQLLKLAQENNLPIKMARTELKSKQFRILSAVGDMLPSYATGYSRQRVWPPGSAGVSDSNLYYNLLFFPVFNGGADMLNLLRSLNEKRAASYSVTATTNDVLLDVYNKYQDLLLQRALLDVRIKAVDVSKRELESNEDRKAAGEGTIFEVLQSRTRVALDEQLLLRQQVSFRQAALKLAVAVNLSPAVNITPLESALSETLMLNDSLDVNAFLNQAIENRPELKENEQLKLAARKASLRELSPLLPNSRFFLATTTTGSGSGADSLIIPAGGALAGGSISAGDSGSSGSGGSGTNTTVSGGFILNWLLPGLGLSNTGSSLALREEARKIALKGQQLVLNIVEEVRSSYLQTLSAREEIAVAYKGTVSATEELRVADMRLKYNVGTNLELLSAQRDYFDALSRQAEAIVNYRKSQAKLLRDTGTISIAALTSDKRPIQTKNKND